MKLLLHACCGPCLLEPYDALVADGHQVRVAYANPNIHPREEYERRRDTLLAYAAGRGIDVDELDYDVERWNDAVRGLEDRPGARCRACYRVRLGDVARLAAALGCDAVSTTLTVSPWQDQEGIREVGEQVCSEAGVSFLYVDYRERYPEATRRSRDLGMYRQNYCGCRYSDAEAQAERAARRAARQAAKGR